MTDAGAWMPLYIGDYLADTMRLEGPEHGAYLLLIMHYWRNGPLPNDQRTLAAIARTKRPAWAAMADSVTAFFRLGEDGKWHHKRIDKELGRIASVVDQKRAAGKASAARRALQREANEKATPVGHSLDSVDGSVANERSTKSNQSQSQSYSKKDSEAKASDAAARANGEEPPIRDRLWREGLPIIRDLTGLSESQARAFLGGLVKRAADDCSRVFRVVQEAGSLRPIDPKGWLTKAASPPAGHLQAPGIF